MSLTEQQRQREYYLKRKNAKLLLITNKNLKYQPSTLNYNLIKYQHEMIIHCMKLDNLELLNPSIWNLGCSAVYFKEYIKRKMTPGMTFYNIHYSKIKPISKFFLEENNQLLMACNYTNFQPLLSIENKTDDWDGEQDMFWRENIIFKEYLPIYN